MSIVDKNVEKILFCIVLASFPHFCGRHLSPFQGFKLACSLDLKFRPEIIICHAK